MTKTLNPKKNEKTAIEIKALVTYGVPIDSISHYVGIPEQILWDLYGKEIITARTKARAKIGQFCFYLASGEAMKDGVSARDCAAMAMFLLKTQTDEEITAISNKKCDKNFNPELIFIETVKNS